MGGIIFPLNEWIMKQACVESYSPCNSEIKTTLSEKDMCRFFSLLVYRNNIYFIISSITWILNCLWRRCLLNEFFIFQNRTMHVGPTKLKTLHHFCTLVCWNYALWFQYSLLVNQNQMNIKLIQAYIKATLDRRKQLGMITPPSFLLFILNHEQ